MNWECDKIGHRIKGMIVGRISEIEYLLKDEIDVKLESLIK